MKRVFFSLSSTSQRAANLSKAIQEEVKSYKSNNFDLHYEVFDISEGKNTKYSPMAIN